MSSSFRNKVSGYRQALAEEAPEDRRAKFLQLLRGIALGDLDAKGRHVAMDALLLARLGDDEALEVYAEVERWYS